MAVFQAPYQLWFFWRRVDVDIWTRSAKERSFLLGVGGNWGEMFEGDVLLI